MKRGGRAEGREGNKEKRKTNAERATGETEGEQRRFAP